MTLAQCQREAYEIKGIVYKPTNYIYKVAKSFMSFAVKVVMHCQNPHVCFYEVISQEQCTYVDLDLKRAECLRFPKEVKKYSKQMVLQFLDLLEWGYNKYLKVNFSRDNIIIGDSSAAEKISFHVTFYDKVHS